MPLDWQKRNVRPIMLALQRTIFECHRGGRADVRHLQPDCVQDPSCRSAFIQRRGMTMTRTMKRRVVLGLSLAAAAVVSTGLVVGVRADRRDVAIRAALRGLNEVPPTASRAVASLRASLDEDAQTFTFTLTFRDLSGPPV